MKRLYRITILILLSCVLAALVLPAAQAAPTPLYSGMLRIEQMPGGLNPDKQTVTDREGQAEYFYHVENMLPGDYFVQTYQVKNLDTSHAYEMWFRTEDAVNWFRGLDDKQYFTEDGNLGGYTLNDLKVGYPLYGLKVPRLKQIVPQTSTLYRNSIPFDFEQLIAHLKTVMRGYSEEKLRYSFTLEDLKAGGSLYGYYIQGLSESSLAAAAFTQNGSPFSDADLRNFLKEHRLLKQLELWIYYTENNASGSEYLLYEGPMDGSGTYHAGWKPYPEGTPKGGEMAIYLGNLAPNQEGTIRAEVRLPGRGTDNEFQRMGGQITWVFSIFNDDGGDVAPPPSRPPTNPPPPPTTTTPTTGQPPTTTTTPTTGQPPSPPTETPPDYGEETVPSDTPPLGDLTDSPEETDTSGFGDETVPPTSGPVSPPKTGDETRQTFYLIATLISLSALTFAAIAVWRRRDGASSTERE